MPRTLAKGRTYVYMLPCREQDLLKVGFSRQPLVRMRTLHRRFFELFDLERGLLLEVDRLAQARTIEREILMRHATERSPAPLSVNDEAAGYSEWLRGVSPQVSEALRQAAEEGGFILHRLRPWLHEAFSQHADGLFAWSAQMMEAIEFETYNVPAERQRGQAGRALGYALDACEAVGLDLATLFDPRALAWRDSSAST